MRLRALRGAITVDRNDPDDILERTEELVRSVMERNGLAPDDLVSCIFTSTSDLDAEFPAVAARRLGLDAVPLLCAREIDVPGALPRVIRLLVHCYGSAWRKGARRRRRAARSGTGRATSCWRPVRSCSNRARRSSTRGRRARCIRSWPPRAAPAR